MKIILDFAVWTLGVAIALPIWLESTFLPRAHDMWFWVVIAAMLLSAVSAVVGIWFRSAASKVLALSAAAGPSGNERQLKIGALHSCLLVAALALSAVAFAWLKVISPEPAARCELLLPGAEGTPAITLKFDCSAAVAESVKT